MRFVFDPPQQASVKVKGGGLLPVRRIFCIGRNYADHVREMGGDPKSSPPVFFTKPADAVAADGMQVPYAQATTNLHFEGELVAALGGGGKDISCEEEAEGLVYGYAAGCDLTRRDHQAQAKDTGAPWDSAKGFDLSAPVGEIIPKAKTNITAARLRTFVNGEERQNAPLDQMIWSVPEILVALSKQFELKAGDLIFTGTPQGVGSLAPGDKVKVTVGDDLSLQFGIS